MGRRRPIPPNPPLGVPSLPAHEDSPAVLRGLTQLCPVSVQHRGCAWRPHPPLSLHRAWKQARAYWDKELQAPRCSDCAWGRDTLGYRGPRALGLRGSLPYEAGPGQRREPAPLAGTEDKTGERPCLSRGDLLAGRWLWGWEAEPEPCRFGGQGWADTLPLTGAFQAALVVKNSPASAGDIRDPWVEKTPWRRAWYPLQCSCLEDPMDRGAWRATVRGITQSLTQLKWLSTLPSLPQTDFNNLLRTGKLRDLQTLQTWWHCYI